MEKDILDIQPRYLEESNRTAVLGDESRYS